MIKTMIEFSYECEAIHPDDPNENPKPDENDSTVPSTKEEEEEEDIKNM